MGMTGSIIGGAKAAKKIGASLVPSVAAPIIEEPIAMPDPLQQQAARERSLIEQLSRRGRQGTILTSAGGSKLGS